MDTIVDEISDPERVLGNMHLKCSNTYIWFSPRVCMCKMKKTVAVTSEQDAAKYASGHAPNEELCAILKKYARGHAPNEELCAILAPILGHREHFIVTTPKTQFFRAETVAAATTASIAPKLGCCSVAHVCCPREWDLVLCGPFFFPSH